MFRNITVRDLPSFLQILWTFRLLLCPPSQYTWVQAFDMSTLSCTTNHQDNRSSRNIPYEQRHELVTADGICKSTYFTRTLLTQCSETWKCILLTDNQLFMLVRNVTFYLPFKYKIGNDALCFIQIYILQFIVLQS